MPEDDDAPAEAVVEETLSDSQIDSLVDGLIKSANIEDDELDALLGGDGGGSGAPPTPTAKAKAKRSVSGGNGGPKAKPAAASFLSRGVIVQPYPHLSVSHRSILRP